MIPLLPKWNLMPSRPSFYDTDSATLLELASTLHETVNKLIEEHNSFVETTNETIVNLYADQVPTTQKIINDAIKDGSFKIVESYDPNTEHLNITITGGV